MKKKKSEKSTEKKTPVKNARKLGEKDFEKKVVSLANQGLTAEKIGESLRKEGIHPKEHGKKISKILIENNIYQNPDMKNIGEKLARVQKHWGNNRKDKRAMREVVRVSAQIRRLKKYLKISA